jgi:hypothetical protein
MHHNPTVHCFNKHPFIRTLGLISIFHNYCYVMTEKNNSPSNVLMYSSLECKHKLCTYYSSYLIKIGSQDSVVSIAISYRLDDWGAGVRVPVGSRFFSFPCYPDQLCGPPDLLSNGYRGYFLGGGLSGRSVQLTTHLQLVPRSRKCGSIHPLPHMPSWLNA